MSEIKDQRKDWHLEKSVSIGHLVTTGMAVIALVLAWAEMNARIEYNSIENGHQTESIKRLEGKQDKQTLEIKQEIQQLRVEQRTDSSRINEKLDRLIERNLGNGH